MRLTPGDRYLLVNAVLLIALTRLLMSLASFRTQRRILSRVARRMESIVGPELSTDKITWAVRVASRCVPRAETCLTQALAAQVMLAGRRRPARLHIGVAKSDRGRFEAHAWVESEGRVVIGASQPGRFTLLTVLDEADLS